MIDTLLVQLGDGAMAAPLLGLAIGFLLGLSPAALPMVPAVLATASPGRIDEQGVRRRLPLLRVAPSIIAFTAGMNGVLGLVGYLFVTVTIALTRASVVLHGSACCCDGPASASAPRRSRPAPWRRSDTGSPSRWAAVRHAALSRSAWARRPPSWAGPSMAC